MPISFCQMELCDPPTYDVQLMPIMSCANKNIMIKCACKLADVLHGII